MWVYRILTVIFLFIGLKFVVDYVLNINSPTNIKVKRNIYKKNENSRKEALTGKKVSRIEKFKASVEDDLKLSNTKLTWEQFEIVIILSGIVGVIIGFLLNNIVLSLVLGAITGYIPAIIIRMKKYKYSMILNDQLQYALNTVTTSYLKNDDINISVRDNLHRIDDPLNIVFREFVASNMFIDSDIVKNIKYMRERINNHFFHEWCDSLILCQSDRNVKYILPTIIEEMSDVKNMQEETNTMMFQIYKEFALVAGIILGNIPFMKILNADWFMYLTQTIPGKVIVIMTVLVVFVSFLYVVKVNKPLSDI